MSPKVELSQTSIPVKGRQVRLFLCVVFHSNQLLVLYCYKTNYYELFLILNGGLTLGLAAPAI